jgi:transcriptional regulator with XRE-family HTH domain
MSGAAVKCRASSLVRPNLLSYLQLGKYECGLHTPQLDKLVSLAEALETTVDYLVTGSPAQNVPLHNTQLLERFKVLEGFNANDQETVIKLIDAMIVKQRVESAMQPLGRERLATAGR